MHTAASTENTEPLEARAGSSREVRAGPAGLGSKNFSTFEPARLGSKIPLKSEPARKFPEPAEAKTGQGMVLLIDLGSRPSRGRGDRQQSKTGFVGALYYFSFLGALSFP